MHGDVIGLVALDLILRIILARVMDVSFVVRIFRVNLNDPATDAARLGVPANVIAHFEPDRHGQLVGAARWTSSLKVSHRSAGRLNSLSRGFGCHAPYRVQCKRERV